ncbi:hypothetical protein DFH09DRAFT_1488678 [Mycena vulgaris]|nr:hypothetical protein DFH09DRAFT_1488678 [Mycena vulgaris]
MSSTPISRAKSAEAPTRVEGLWFEDCGLVIREENTVFRVSRDVLAAQSPVFRDVLTLPSPKDADTMDGCPLVKLPDSVKDVNYFLRALFDYECAPSSNAAFTHPFLNQVFQLVSRSYNLLYNLGDPPNEPQIRGGGAQKRALAHFSSGYATVLAKSPLVKATQSWAHCGNYISIIALARQVSADWIIPIALYRLCAELKEEEIIRGVVYKGTTIRLSEGDPILALRTSSALRGDATSQVLAFLWLPAKIDGCLRRYGNRKTLTSISRQRSVEDV